MSILQTRQLWSHDSRLSNDTRETDYALGLMAAAIEDLDGEPGYNEFVKPAYDVLKDPFNPFQLRSIDGYLVIASFSEEPNLLSQWRAYAPANGYSIGFERNKLEECVKRAGFAFGQVQYSFNAALALFRRKIRAHIAAFRRGKSEGEATETLLSQLESLVLSTVPLVKHPSFEEEKEWRAFKFTTDAAELKFYAGQKCITPYIPIEISEGDRVKFLKEVIVGPSDDQHTLSRWTRDYLNSLGYTVARMPKAAGVRVYVSGSPYRLNR